MSARSWPPAAWFLLAGIPLLIFFVLDSTPGDNRFGPNPKGA